MGMNYYYLTDVCEQCGRSTEHHIGKSSYGWVFMFHSFSNLKSWKDVKNWLVATEGKLVDEEGTEISLESFETLIKYKKSEVNDGVDLEPGSDKYWHDDEGYSFSSWEFC